MAGLASTGELAVGESPSLATTIVPPSAVVFISATSPDLLAGASVVLSPAQIVIDASSPTLGISGSVFLPSVVIDFTAAVPVIGEPAIVLPPAAQVTVESVAPIVGSGVLVAIPAAAEITVSAASPAINLGVSLHPPSALILIDGVSPNFGKGATVELGNPVTVYGGEAIAEFAVSEANPGFQVEKPPSTIIFTAAPPTISGGTVVFMPSASVVTVTGTPPSIVTRPRRVRLFAIAS